VRREGIEPPNPLIKRRITYAGTSVSGRIRRCRNDHSLRPGVAQICGSDPHPDDARIAQATHNSCRSLSQ
jgi:hypothetical protein